MPTLTGLHRSANPSMQLVSTTQTQYLSGHVQLPPGRKQRGVHPNRLGKRRERGADKSLWMQGMQAAGNAGSRECSLPQAGARTPQREQREAASTAGHSSASCIHPSSWIYTGNLQPLLQPPSAPQRGAGCDQAANTQPVPVPAGSVGVFSLK